MKHVQILRELLDRHLREVDVDARLLPCGAGEPSCSTGCAGGRVSDGAGVPGLTAEGDDAVSC